MSKGMQQKRIAILATDGFEQSELEQPMKAYRDAGATCEIVSLKSGAIPLLSHSLTVIRPASFEAGFFDWAVDLD